MNDDWIAAGHSVAGRRDRLRIDPDPIDDGYGEIRRLEMLDKALLMQRAPLRKRFKHGIPDLRLIQFSVGDLEIEFCQVATVKVPDQVSRAQIERCPDLLHFLPARTCPPIFQSVRPCTDDYAIFQSTVLGLHSKYASNRAYNRLRSEKGGHLVLADWSEKARWLRDLLRFHPCGANSFSRATRETSRFRTGTG